VIAVTASTSKDKQDQWLKWMGLCTLLDLDCYSNFPENVGMVKAYQTLYETFRTDHELIAFLHDDLEILEPLAVRHLFEKDPKLAILGFGGATGLAVDDIYKTPYRIEQLQRINYASNQVDWEVHGTRETGVKDVVVVDGFAIVARTSFLDLIGGWSGFPFGFHCYDLYLCLMAARLGWKVKMQGVRCHHHGGGTSTGVEYAEMLRKQGKTVEADHQEPHIWLYDNFRDELPLRVKANGS